MIVVQNLGPTKIMRDDVWDLPLGHGSTDENRESSALTTKIVFLGGITALGLCSGFGSAVAMAKKRDSQSFDKGLLAGAERLEGGGSLALRALGWGTLFAVGGVGLLCFSVYKIMDVQSAEDFRTKMAGVMPRVAKRPPKDPSERTEFASMREFFEYYSKEKPK